MWRLLYTGDLKGDLLALTLTLTLTLILTLALTLNVQDTRDAEGLLLHGCHRQAIRAIAQVGGGCCN